MEKEVEEHHDQHEIVSSVPGDQISTYCLILVEQGDELSNSLRQST